MKGLSTLSDRQGLRLLAQQKGYGSLAALAQAAGVSEWQLARIERGLLPHIPVGVFVKVAIALKMSLDELMLALGASEIYPSNSPDDSNQSDQLAQSDHIASLQAQCQTLEREYERLQIQLAAQSGTLMAQFQRQVIDTLEPWLLQWPTAAAAARQNPDFPGQKLLPLTRPIATLLAQWDIEAIAAVGDRVPYDPRWHAWMGSDNAPTEGTNVMVRYVGYRQGDQLLYRAKVSLPPETPPP